LSELAKLKPTEKLLMMDLVREAGIDVSGWSKFKGGIERAASNPRFCYEWAFVEPKKVVVLNLWYDSMKERNGEIRLDTNARNIAKSYLGARNKSVVVKRAQKLDHAIQTAYSDGLPVRVVVCHGKRRKMNEPDSQASRVNQRLLDSIAWAVTDYDWSSGQCTLTRGTKPEPHGSPKDVWGLKVGDVVDNKKLKKLFLVSGQGGMRRSKRKNVLLLISDATKSLYDDRWDGDLLHYTGMGQRGDQKLKGTQNSTVYHSRTKPMPMLLFEVFEEGQYIYAGEVELSADPYQETQPDINERPRKVWMFPLQFKGRGRKAVPTSGQIVRIKETRTRKLRTLSTEKLRQRAKSGARKPTRRTAIYDQINRNEAVVEYVKRKAKGICDLCTSPAPFRTRKKEPFLECHHITWLSKGGEDTIENAVALCPNCHRKMHLLNLAKDRTELQFRVKKRETSSK